MPDLTAVPHLWVVLHQDPEDRAATFVFGPYMTREHAEDAKRVSFTCDHPLTVIPAVTDVLAALAEQLDAAGATVDLVVDLGDGRN